ncbi:MAG: hypothetical protein JOZ69_18435 [Myxococcales bacterium]|nr:hypothetical protein [Myxococcales bacterium]
MVIGCVVIGCGNAPGWDLADGGGAAGRTCSTNQECANGSSTLYCCDLSAGVGNGRGLCYQPPTPATSCPAVSVADAGARVVDAGRTMTDAGRPFTRR